MRYSVFPDNIGNFLGIRSIGYGEDPNITRFGPGCRNQYMIHYVTDGEGYYNGNTVCAGKGFLIYPGQRECYYPSEKDPWKFVWIIAEGNLMKEIFERFCADGNTGIFSFDDLDLVKECACYIVENTNKIVSALKISEVFLHVLNSHISSVPCQKPRTNADVYIDFCIKYIEDNIHEKICVNKIADTIGVSQPYLYKIFSERFNMSLKKYITLSKHAYVKKILTTTELTIKEIANSVGCQDSFAFSKAFKKIEGMSPQKFREKEQKDLC